MSWSTPRGWPGPTRPSSSSRTAPAPPSPTAPSPSPRSPSPATAWSTWSPSDEALEIAVQASGCARAERGPDPRHHRSAPGAERPDPEVTGGASTEGLLPRAGGTAALAVVRRYGELANAEDAVQEALIAAASMARRREAQRPAGLARPGDVRRMIDGYRSDDARRRREDLAASWSRAGPADPSPPPGQDDTLILVFMCCHPSLTPASAIPLTLGAVGGADPARRDRVGVPRPRGDDGAADQPGQARVKASDNRSASRPPESGTSGCGSCCTSSTCCSTEGYASSSRPDLAATQPAPQARPSGWPQAVRAALPEDPKEVAGLLALMVIVATPS